MPTRTIRTSGAARRAVSVPISPASSAPRWIGVTEIALGAVLAAVALLGPLATGVIDWRISGLVRNQLLGLDAVSLLVVAPLAVVAGVLVLRGRPLGAALGLPPAFYVAYMVPQYVLGPDYLGLDGNNERAFPIMLALFVLAVVNVAATWTVIDLRRLPTAPARERLVGRVLLPLAAVIVFSRYATTLPGIMSAAPTAADYLAGPTFVWTIVLLDLGIGLPAIVATCIGVRRGAAWSSRALYAVVGSLALIGLAVAGMAVAMLARDDPSMTAGAMATMVALGAALAAMAAYLYAPLVRGGEHRT